MSDKSRWLLVALYAAAMAWVESAVVFYLRVMIDRVEPYQPNPLPMTIFDFGRVELVREAATLIMLLAVGVLAGKTTRARFGYAAIAFGIWDILYYVFPHPDDRLAPLAFRLGYFIFDPAPWWGPVLAPVLISTLMIILGRNLLCPSIIFSAAKDRLVVGIHWRVDCALHFHGRFDSSDRRWR